MIHTIPGRPFGDSPFDLLIIGEAPGREEINQHKVFVGPSGQLLMEALTACGRSAYITNTYDTVEQKPDGSIVPIKVEKRQDITARIAREIRQYRFREVCGKPVMVLLGGVALKEILKGGSITSAVGQVFTTWLGGRSWWCFPIVHPAAVLRKPQQNRELWDFGWRVLHAALTPVETANYELVATPSELEMAQFGTTLSTKPRFAFDLETTGLNKLEDKIIGVGVSYKPGHAKFFSLKPLLDVGDRYYKESCQLLSALFPHDNPAIKIAHNAKFDLAFLLNHLGHELSRVVDTLSMAYLLGEPQHSLAWLTAKYLPQYLLPMSGMDRGNIADTPIESVAKYCCAQVDATLQLADILLEKLNSAQKRLVFQFYSPLIQIFAKAELLGIGLDIDRTIELDYQLGQQIESIQREIEKAIGRGINLNSTKQIRELLFNELGLKPVHTTPTGQNSTDEKTINKLADQHPVVAKIAEYRKLTKMRSTYTKNFLEHADSCNRVHANYRIYIPNTSRFASTDVNLHNIPRESKIRSLFIPSDGFVFIIADYSQAELAILGWYAKEEKIIEPYTAGEDLHTATARLLFGKQEISKEERQAGKTTNFATVYGQSAAGLAEQWNIPVEQAQDLLSRFFAAYPKVTDWINKIRAKAAAGGTLRNAYGRERDFKFILDLPEARKQHYLKQAVNWMIQTTASDYAKFNIIRLERLLKNSFPTSSILHEVHDSVIVECPVDKADELLPAMKECLSQPVPPIDLTLRLDIKVTKCWE